MNKRPYIYLPIFFALVLLLGIFLGTLLIPAIQSKNGIFSFDLQNYDKIQQVISYIEDDYVDSTDRAALENMTINGLLQQLDPHSVYIPAEDFAAANDPLKGNFDGIGIQFRIIRDSITVISLIPGGPSEKGGLLAGDRIVSIDGKKVAGVTLKDDDAVKMLKGPGGTRVKLGIYRKTEGKSLTKTITRGNIPTSSIDIAFMATATVGYIRLSRFSNNTGEEFIRAANDLRASGMKKLVLDLRGNGGGVMDAAITIADQFLPGDKMIVYTEGYHRKKQDYISTSEGGLEGFPVAVLIDEFSASASEILAGALQDNDIGVIVGRRSFGKGLVQEQIQMPDGSALRLTVARYHTPTGRCIQKPYTDDFEKYYADFYMQFMTEEEYQDSLNFADTMRFTTPGGKTVYGGGGIMPDVYVSAKHEYPSAYYKKLLSNAVIAGFAFDWADAHRLELDLYGDAATFVREFRVTPRITEELAAYAEKKGVAMDRAGWIASEKMIEAELKGQIGRVIYNDPAFYPVILPQDKVFQEALKALR